VTPNWDIGIVVPLEKVSIAVNSHATIIRNSASSARVHNFGPTSNPPGSGANSDTLYATDQASGIGDVLLRTKYNFVRDRENLPDMAAAAQVRLPTGNEADLLGTGETTILAMFVASKAIGRFEPHMNIGYEAWTDHSDLSAVRYVVGVDAQVVPALTTAVELIGQWRPNGPGIGDNILDLAIGAKWNVLRTFLLNANLQFPLNKSEGLRANVIWTVGAEYTF
jgi:hypothetical protein